MQIRDWWSGHTSERYWMEITDRHDVGADLFAPTLDGGGRPYWGYELITHVRPGDVVLHWHKTMYGEGAVVGWSRATGAYEDTDISWQARGTVGRASGNLHSRPAWRMPLEGFVFLARPVMDSDVRKVETQLRVAKAHLEASHGNVSYFPFAFSDKRPIRASQTYFVKMPASLLSILGLDDLVGTPSLPAAKPSPGRSPKAGKSGYIADSVVRSAIEWRAVAVATRWYEGQGYACEYTGANKPYDIVATQGSDVRRVEVKGSSGKAETVELTAGEVKNAGAFDATDLFVVDGITYARLENGSVEASGGFSRRYADWAPTETALEVTRYRYMLPPLSDDLGELD
ncbi:DUF3883 domain-containing protein [Nocardioides sp. HDW12B]|uniref:protein NO VEIN domain-containing protein n=1 Tax=Nocardioides sp. HDW12B TaxID=2714939 RepID=UPI00140DE253|nr:DUF3883 domain-containing protein [Nocardioides sp. HDW12B]QIK65621.1 DUF3883 domain-containing protein [Nocardioides sp. HDW12B]